MQFFSGPLFFGREPFSGRGKEGRIWGLVFKPFFGGDGRGTDFFEGTDFRGFLD
jgi:hypothetical protein